MSKPKRPREGQESAWATYFAAVLRAQGHDQAAASLLASLPKESEKRLPRGVYEKVPGSGDYWIRYADPSGKIRRQHVGRSLAAARDIAERRRSEVRQGKFDPESVGRQRRHKMTVAEMFATYLPLRVKVRNKVEDQRYADYWASKFGGLELDELTPLDLERWRVGRLQAVKPATVNRALEYLKAFYQLALRDGHCESNPVVKVSLLAENNERTRFLSESEESELASKMEPADFDLVVFAIHSGLRRGEQFTLRWEFVDFEHRFVKIPRTKAGKYRIIPLNAEALAVLRRQRVRAKGSDWVFPSTRRPDVHRSAQNFVQRVFDPALEEAKISDFVWHDLRRTFASRLAIAGQPLNTIGDLMGHNTPAMTKRYAYLSPGHLHDAVNALSKKKAKGPPPESDAVPE